MIGRTQKANALAVLLNAWKNFGNRGFRVEMTGANYRPLKDAESLGWCWFDGPRCGILEAGLVAIEPWRQDVPRRRLTTYRCQVCGTRVEQRDGPEGLPEKPHCPACAARTAEATEAFRLKHPS